MKKKWGNVGALNFGGAMERLARGYSSVVELSTADRMVSGSNPDVPYLLGIGVRVSDVKFHEIICATDSDYARS